MARARRSFVSPARDGEVELGERVTVLDLTTAVADDYRVVDTEDGWGAGDVSSRSPLGLALLGRHIGDVIQLRVGNETVRLEVVEIDG